ncbi:hypothetical protein MPER_01326, partial [Moniliophthora perniciosa FA553]
YDAFLRIVREWRILRMLRRGGRGNDGIRKVNDTHPGELAVSCIACPKPGVNLPDNWEEVPVDLKLKRKRISSWAKDPTLQDGWAYFVEQTAYNKWVCDMQEQKEMSTCTGLSALDHANTKYNIGYDETGKGAGLCSRHEIMLANGLGALQAGEKYASLVMYNLH